MHSAVLAVAWCRPVTLVYCIETAKDINKRFSPFGSHIILVFLAQPLQNSEGKNLSGALNTQV